MKLNHFIWTVMSNIDYQMFKCVIWSERLPENFSRNCSKDSTLVAFSLLLQGTTQKRHSFRAYRQHVANNLPVWINTIIVNFTNKRAMCILAMQILVTNCACNLRRISKARTKYSPQLTQAFCTYLLASDNDFK